MSEYSATDARHELDEARAEHKEREIERLTDDLLTAVINGDKHEVGNLYDPWFNYEDVAGYLDEDGLKAMHKFLQEAHLGAIMPETRKAYDDAMKRAAEEVVTTFECIKEL